MQFIYGEERSPHLIFEAHFFSVINRLRVLLILLIVQGSFFVRRRHKPTSFFVRRCHK